MFVCPEWVILQKSGLNWLYPLFHVTVRTTHDSDCPSKWLCHFREMMVLKLCHYVLFIYMFCLSQHSYQYCDLSCYGVSVLSVSWQFCFISDYCAPYHTADVGNTDRELFVFFSFSFKYTGSSISVCILSHFIKTQLCNKHTVLHCRDNEFQVIEWESSVTRVTLMQALSPGR